MSGREFFPDMSCKYTVAPGAKLPDLMSDLTLMLSSVVGLMDHISLDVAGKASPATKAFWAGLYLLRQVQSIANEAEFLVSQADDGMPTLPIQEGGAA